MLVGCLFRGLTKFLFEAGKSLTEKVEQEREKVAECIHFREVDCWKSKCQRKSVLSL